MSRTTPTLVKSILYFKDYDGSTDLQAYIDSASSVVDDLVSCAADKAIVLNDTKLELIERWLSAHAYVMTDQTYAEKQTGQAKGKFQGQTGMRLEATKYGQMAMILDPTGCLAALNRQAFATLEWGGKPKNKQIEYDRRN